MKIVRKRNRQQTMERILTALGEVIAERGAEKAGINAVAEKAGVNKVLIYRYFGGYEGLMERFIQQGHFLSYFNEQFIQKITEHPSEEPPSRLWSDYVIGLLRELRNRRSSQELLKWEMANNSSELSKRLSTIRNESLAQIIRHIAPQKEYDPVAISAVLLSAITHLALLSPHPHTIIDIDLQSDEGWHRIERAIRRIYMSLNLAFELEEAKK